MSVKKKYQDAPRFPKVTNGYEGDMMTTYNHVIVDMVKVLGLKMKQLVESQDNNLSP